MQILHFADAHIGVTLYGHINRRSGINTRVEDFLHSLDGISNYAKEHDVDLIVFAGDAFHKRNPKSVYQIEFAKRIMDMAKQCPVVLLVGNHDTTGDHMTSALEMYEAISADNVYVGDSYEVIDIDTKSGPVQVATFPYPTLKSLSINNRDDMLTAALNEIMDLEELIDEDVPSIFLGHAMVETVTFGNYRSMLPQDEIHISLDDLLAGPWNYVALGHVHMHQNLNESNNPPIVYSGSTERIDIGESLDKKGFCHVSINESETSWEFVPLDVRAMHVLDIDLTTRLNKDYTDYVISIIHDYGFIFEDAIVRIKMKIKDTDVGLIHITQIEKVLKHASHVSFAYDRQHTERRTRLSTKNVQSLTDIELLEMYFDERISDDEEYNAILDVAEDIVREVNESY